MDGGDGDGVKLAIKHGNRSHFRTIMGIPTIRLVDNMKCS